MNHHQFTEKLAPQKNLYFRNNILQHIELAPQIFRMRIQNSYLSEKSRPGQFINIKITETHNPLWRRPFSIHRINSELGWFEILYRVVGKGTAILSQKKAGEEINFIGPLGNSFGIDNIESGTVIIVAGGLGIAPFYFLCQALPKSFTIHLFWGVKSASEFCGINDYKALPIDLQFATEDGSMGYRGFITKLLNAKLSKQSINKPATIFACGPNAMLHAVSQIAQQHHFPCEVSLETVMACGVGACLGCGVSAKSKEIGYYYVCKDGPVFNANEIILSE